MKCYSLLHTKKLNRGLVIIIAVKRMARRRQRQFTANALMQVASASSRAITASVGITLSPMVCVIAQQLCGARLQRAITLLIEQLLRFVLSPCLHSFISPRTTSNCILSFTFCSRSTPLRERSSIASCDSSSADSNTWRLGMVADILLYTFSLTRNLHK